MKFLGFFKELLLDKSIVLKSAATNVLCLLLRFKLFKVLAHKLLNELHVEAVFLLNRWASLFLLFISIYPTHFS
jgi:hypothetical protein